MSNMVTYTELKSTKWPNCTKWPGPWQRSNVCGQIHCSRTQDHFHLCLSFIPLLLVLVVYTCVCVSASACTHTKETSKVLKRELSNNCADSHWHTADFIYNRAEGRVFIITIIIMVHFTFTAPILHL